MTLSPTFTPPERMAEIRKLLRDVGCLRQVCAERRGVLYERRYDEVVENLLGHLDQAEAEGSLAECEQMLRVSYGGAA